MIEPSKLAKTMALMIGLLAAVARVVYPMTGPPVPVTKMRLQLSDL